MDKQIATFKLTVDPAELREIVSQGKLSEFVNTVASNAARSCP